MKARGGGIPAPAEAAPAWILKRNEPGLSWARLPELPQAAGVPPAWEEFIDRHSDPIATLAWIGSVFDPENVSRDRCCGGRGQGRTERALRFAFYSRAFGSKHLCRHQ